MIQKLKNKDLAQKNKNNYFTKKILFQTFSIIKIHLLLNVKKTCSNVTTWQQTN